MTRWKHSAEWDPSLPQAAKYIQLWTQLSSTPREWEFPRRISKPYFETFTNLLPRNQAEIWRFVPIIIWRVNKLGALADEHDFFALCVWLQKNISGQHFTSWQIRWQTWKANASRIWKFLSMLFRHEALFVQTDFCSSKPQSLSHFSFEIQSSTNPFQTDPGTLEVVDTFRIWRAGKCIPRFWNSISVFVLRALSQRQ